MPESRGIGRLHAQGLGCARIEGPDQGILGVPQLGVRSDDLLLFLSHRRLGAGHFDGSQGAHVHPDLVLLELLLGQGQGLLLVRQVLHREHHVPVKGLGAGHEGDDGLLVVVVRRQGALLRDDDIDFRGVAPEAPQEALGVHGRKAFAAIGPGGAGGEIGGLFGVGGGIAHLQVPPPGEGLEGADGERAVPGGALHFRTRGGMCGGEVLAGGFGVARDHPVEAALGDVDLGLGGGSLLPRDLHLEVVLHGNAQRLLEGEPLHRIGGLSDQGVADQQNREYMGTEHHYSWKTERPDSLTSAF